MREVRNSVIVVCGGVDRNSGIVVCGGVCAVINTYDFGARAGEAVGMVV